MGWDIALGPPSEFKGWSQEEWQNYWRDNEWVSERLGSNYAMESIVETIRLNLENGEYGSVFSYLQQITKPDFIGWYHTELLALLEEIKSLMEAFKKLPLDKQVRLIIDLDTNSMELEYYSGEHLKELETAFRRRRPDAKLENLFDLNYHFLHTMHEFIEMALEQGKGLLMDY